MPSILFSSKKTSPASGATIPEMTFRMEVFPAPFAPTRMTIAPSSTSRETLSTANDFPYRTVTFLTLSTRFFPKVSPQHFLVIFHLFVTAFRDLDPEINDDNPVAQLHQPHVMFDQEDRRAAGPDSLDSSYGVLDFLAGRVRRAPAVVRSLGLEWAWRLMLQPWRLRRQAVLPVYWWLERREAASGRGVAGG